MYVPIDTCAKLSTKFFIEKSNNVAIHRVPIDNQTHIFKPNNTIRNLVSDLDEWWMLSDVSMSSTLANEWAKYVYDVKNKADDAVLNTIKQKSKNLLPSELPSTSHCHDL